MSKNTLNDLGSSLGEYLREQRTAARLSLRQLSALAGVSNPYLSQIERGLKRPSAEILQQLAKGSRSRPRASMSGPEFSTPKWRRPPRHPTSGAPSPRTPP